MPGRLGARLAPFGGGSLVSARNQPAVDRADLNLLDPRLPGDADVEAVDQPAVLAFELGRSDAAVRHDGERACPRGLHRNAWVGWRGERRGGQQGDDGDE